MVNLPTKPTSDIGRGSPHNQTSRLLSPVDARRAVGNALCIPQEQGGVCSSTGLYIT